MCLNQHIQYENKTKNLVRQNRAQFKASRVGFARTSNAGEKQHAHLLGEYVKAHTALKIFSWAFCCVATICHQNIAKVTHST